MLVACKKPDFNLHVLPNLINFKMGLLTDDCDINQNELETFTGGNGDYYISVRDNSGKNHAVRVTTSGGTAPVEVLLAVANLHREMVKAGFSRA